MDSKIEYLFNRLRSIGQLEKINIIVLSDHGMASALDKPIVATDYIDNMLVDLNRTIFGYVSNIYPNHPEQVAFITILFEKKESN